MNFKSLTLGQLFQISTLSLITILLLNGCATSRTTGWEQDSAASSLSAAQIEASIKEGKKLWQTRHIQADLESALQKFKAVADSNPNHAEALVYLTRGYYLLADGHLQDMEQKKKNWEIGISWGEKGMATLPAFKKAVVDEKQSVADAVKLLQKEQIDCLYWSAASLGKWAKNSGIGTTLKYKSQIKAMIERVGELQADYFYGAAPRYWGVYYAVAPGFAGGSMPKSLENFQKSLKIANHYLGTHVLFAENYHARKGDRDAFKKELEFVLNTKANIIPDLMPENTLEQAKAKKMLADMESYF
jgi:tetratricopeptide (TPR) repeat protein